MARLTDAVIERTTTGPPLPHPNLRALRIHFGQNTKVWKFQADSQRHGERRTFKRVLGHWPEMQLDAALTAGLAMRAAIRDGRDPSAVPEGEQTATTLGQAFEKFIARDDIGPRTKYEARSTYNNHLKTRWAGESLKRLGENPQMAEDAHAEITKSSGPIQANKVLRLLRAIYRDAARRDRSLNAAAHPSTSVNWNKEPPAQRAIPFAIMPAWAVQCAALGNPIRRQFHRLCLFTGMRPGELRTALLADVVGDVLTLRDTKTDPIVEIPITEQIVRELEALKEARRAMGMGASRFLFPSDGAGGHIVEWREKRSKLSHWGNSGRHSFKTIATALGVSDTFSDVLQGRSLRKAGMAGTGYINKSELGPAVRAAQIRISAEIDRLLGAA